MNIYEVIKLGFVPIAFNRSPVTSFAVNTTAGVMTIHTEERPDPIYLGLHIEAENVPIELILPVKYTDVLAASFKLSPAIPVTAEEVMPANEYYDKSTMRRRGRPPRYRHDAEYYERPMWKSRAVDDTEDLAAKLFGE